MKKSKFIRSTIILIIGGFITKLLGMIIKIITTNLIGTEGIGIYMLILPTYMLLISIATLGFPVAISKLVAEDKYNNKNLIFSIIPISLVINLILILLLLFSSNFISEFLLRERRTYLGLISIGFVLPFISISSIMRGYFFGKERMFPHIITCIVEEVLRLILIIVFVPIIIPNGIELTISFLIIISIICELSSIIIFILFIKKKKLIKKNDLKPNKNNIKNILNISLPTTGSRLIGSIGYFLEPIILTYVLSKNGYSNSFIITEYGIINGYVLPLILLPSFFTLAISQALIPVVSKYYSIKKYELAQKKIKQAIFFSLIIGIPITLVLILFPYIPLKIIYNNTLGVKYIKVLAFFGIFHYIQSPLTSSLQAMGKSKQAMNGTIYGIIFRTIILFVFSNFKIGMWGLVSAIVFNILIVTFHQMKEVRKCFKS